MHPSDTTSKPLHLQGVLAADLDDTCRPRGLRLLAPDEGEYAILLDDCGYRLLDHLRRWVSVVAQPTVVDDATCLRILSYEVRDFD